MPVLTIQNQLKVLRVGFKSIWADNTLQINGASVFSVDYTDKQEDVILPGTDGAVTLNGIVQNAAAVSIDGLRIRKHVWVPTPGLTLTANLRYFRCII